MKSTGDFSWTQEEEDTLRENIGKISIDDISKLLNRSPMAVKCKAGRMRLMPPNTLEYNLLLIMLRLKFTKPEWFTPNREFLNEAKISQKRWWVLYRGEAKMKDEECKRICLVLQLPFDDIFAERQLEIFV